VLVVLRLGHRRVRDARVTTHVCLTARAMGASAVWVDEQDAALERAVTGVVSRFGGPFEVRTGVGWRKALREFPGVKVHLTMYGLPLDEALPEIRAHARGRDLMVIVGASKVPGEVFGLSDFNVAVGSQPHSEVAALALALDRLSGGAWARTKFKGARVAVRPQARGKKVVQVGARHGRAGEEE
jgi:tRNA (cytidine56-2'-O)-methyltransferase